MAKFFFFLQLKAFLTVFVDQVERADHLQSSSPRVSKEPEVEAPKRKDTEIMGLEDMSEAALVQTPKRLKKKLRKSPNSKSVCTSLDRSPHNGLSIVSQTNSDKVIWLRFGCNLDSLSPSLLFSSHVLS